MSTDKNSNVFDNHQYPQSGDNTGQQGTSVPIEPPEHRCPQRQHYPPDRCVPNSDRQTNS